VRTNKSDLLVNIVAAPPAALFVWLVYNGFRAIFCITIPTTVFSSRAQAISELSVLVHSALYFLLGMLLIRMVSYIRLYRYCSDKFGGIRWRWWYSFPFGQVACIRGHCQICGEPFDQRMFLIFGCSNYKCENCGMLAEEMPRNWPEEINRRVHKQLTKCPCASPEVASLAA
jgi:hypothetical protein